MSDFATVKAQLVATVLNSHSSTTALLAAAMVNQLQALQPEIMPFMERSSQFSTVANQAAYDDNTVGFPKGLLRFDRLYYDFGNWQLYLDVVDPDTLRWFQEQPAVAYPRRIAWQEEKLQFGPAPADVYVVKWDITLDSKKDAATGDEITTASTTQTNPWFTEGVVPFKHLALADYYMTSPDPRPDLAQNQTALAQSQLGRLRSAQKKRQMMNATPMVPNAFDNYGGGGTARIQVFHPGARG